MNHKVFSFIAFLLMLFSFMGTNQAIYAANPPDPTEQFSPFVERMISILNDPELQGDEKCSQRWDKVMEVASERFDFEEMSERVLGRTWTTLNDDEKKYLVILFTKLLKHAYIGKIENLSKQQVFFKNQRINNDRAKIETNIVNGDVVVSVSYIMILKDGVWKVYDVVVEGVSLVRNYMEQFKSILRKEGYPSLLKQVEDKVIALEGGIGLSCPVEIIEKRGE